MRFLNFKSKDKKEKNKDNRSSNARIDDTINNEKNVDTEASMTLKFRRVRKKGEVGSHKTDKIEYELKPDIPPRNDLLPILEELATHIDKIELDIGSNEDEKEKEEK